MSIPRLHFNDVRFEQASVQVRADVRGDEFEQRSIRQGFARVWSKQLAATATPRVRVRDCRNWRPLPSTCRWHHGPRTRPSLYCRSARRQRRHGRCLLSLLWWHGRRWRCHGLGRHSCSSRHGLCQFRPSPQVSPTNDPIIEWRRMSFQ